MHQQAAETLDEAFERLHRTGSEFDDKLSNHGPMAVEALVHSGQWEAVPAWLDVYTHRLEPPTRPTERIARDAWREALGDRARDGDWIQLFTDEIAEQPWREVLALWWPRLLPGLPGGATHGVIRVGHAVRALLEAGESPVRLAEFAHAMAYFASSNQALPELPRLAGGRTPFDALDAVPPLPVGEKGHISRRLDFLAGWDRWLTATLSVRTAETPEEAQSLLADTVHAATLRYLSRGHGSAVMNVHGVTAPSAVLRVLPALPTELWIPSYTAAWATSSAVFAVYMAREDAPDTPAPAADPGTAMESAHAHGDEHVIKLVDTATDVYARSGDSRALSAGVLAAGLVRPLRG
ncbi:questin oxidase family protein [Embleya sp. NPDC005575]|uniref:questin oxidase family protein n=1 Tax=Embleya sp. NPDC005575 TaxID=3156892 RepID=UPI0033BCD8FB